MDPPDVRAVPLSCSPVKSTPGSVGCCATKLLQRQDSPLFCEANSPVPDGSRFRKMPPSQPHQSSCESPGLKASTCTSEWACVPIEVAFAHCHVLPVCST